MDLETRSEHGGGRASRLRNIAKWTVVILIAAGAGMAAALAIFGVPPAQSSLRKALELVEKGDLYEVMEHVDPEGQLGTAWNENEQGLRDTVHSLLERYRIDFTDLGFATRSEGGNAEVELKGGRITVYARDGDSLPLAFYDLHDSGIVIYMEKKGKSWLIEGTNFDFLQALPREGESFSF